MARVMPAEQFAAWFAGFLPRTYNLEPATLFTPATVSDRSDGKIAHLDGLNLSRAWCWRSIAPLLPARECAIAQGPADEHLAAALPHVAGDYMGEHWLASFALLAMLADSEADRHARMPPDILCLAMVPAEGLEPPTFGLQNRCSTN